MVCCIFHAVYEQAFGKEYEIDLLEIELECISFEAASFLLRKLFVGEAVINYIYFEVSTCYVYALV